VENAEAMVWTFAGNAYPKERVVGDAERRGAVEVKFLE
jgi:hypothetical protein